MHWKGSPPKCRFYRNGRKNRTDQVGDSHGDVVEDIAFPDWGRQKDENDDRGHNGKLGKHAVFPAHKGVRALFDQGRDLLDLGVYGLLLLDPQIEVAAKAKASTAVKKDRP